MVNRLAGGLSKLKAANEAVEITQKELTETKPKLEKAEIETNQMMEKLMIDKKEADEKQKVVSKDEVEAQKQTAEAEETAAKAQEAVAEANATLEKVLEEIKKLTSNHLTEIRSFTKPPEPVLWTLAGLCVMLGEKVEKKLVPGTLNEKKEDYYGHAKDKLLKDPKNLLKLLTDFANYEKDNIPQDRIRRLEEKIMSVSEFAKERVESSNEAAKYLHMWIMAMYSYNKIFLKTQPLRDELALKKQELAAKQLQLHEKKRELEKVNATIRSLQEMYDQKIAEKLSLETKKKECELKLDRAQKLVVGLKDEKERWGIEIEELSKGGVFLAGDSVVAAAMVAYSGPFTSEYRQELESSWIQELSKEGIQRSANVSMRAFLGNPVLTQQWNIYGLPKDDTSTENGIIISESRRWCLMIDPQTQANKYLKNMAKDNPGGFDAVKPSEPEKTLTQKLEMAIQYGRWIIYENVGKDLDPILEPILLKQTIKQGGELVLPFGGKNITYSSDFRFYMTTTMPNPHYPPETFVKVTILNFAITPKGLEEQMLAQIVTLENPQVEQKKIEIVKKNAEDRKELQRVEDAILSSLSAAEGDILMDETLINKLQSSKKTSTDINQRVKDSKITEAQTDKAREEYRPVAIRASILFFCIVDLSSIDPMYQYSLQWFTNLFAMAVGYAPTSNQLEQRLKNLNDYFTYSLYENVCRSLFEKHKLNFSLILTVKILEGAKTMDLQAWRYFLAGYTGDAKVPVNPTKWIDDNSWPNIWRQFYGMEQLENMKGIEKHFMEKPDDFRPVYDAIEAHEEKLPEPFESKLDPFEKLIVLKALRSDKLKQGIQNWIALKMGSQFIEAPTFKLDKCFKDSSTTTPLIFVLSAGSDPVADFNRYAEEMGMTKKSETISLGKGQGEKAEKLVKAYQTRGGWVLLQNCHLAVTWMPKLEELCENLKDDVHAEFRLWMTSMPTPYFPISALQNSIKMTLEPPTGLKLNLLRSYENMDDNELNDCKKPEVFKKLLFGFCLFHAIIQDRRKFGPIGWNIAYEFTNEDLGVCKKQLKTFLDEYEEIPYKVLNFIGAEINYGGRVTDDKDVRLINTILAIYINPDVLSDDYKFSKSGIYKSPAPLDQAEYINYIKTLPLNPAPEAFGLHENAEITTAQNEIRTLLETILSVQPRATAKGARSREEIITEIANNVEKKTPAPFDYESVYNVYPTDYKESMNTVLVQEIIKYNNLLTVMKKTLIEVKKALKGEVVMSEELEFLANSLHDNQVPKLWADKGFLSEKPLASWIIDLNDRIEFLSKWVQGGTPNVFWISGFFFPQAFITGMLQNYARKHVIAIDRLGFEFKICDHMTYQEITQKPEDGCYIYGMFLEGARWSSEKHALTDSKPKELYSDLPLIQLLPIADRVQPKTGIYNCPLYKVLSRRGTLSTTGHSTNYVMSLELTSAEEEAIWIRAGVAAFLSLSY